ncbi:MAG: NapC/NirT family cytochrome c, partial [Actinobacteria bacterium]|nr:NapC/NirT family cytochrome c [Actinomycetota bacterium]
MPKLSLGKLVGGFKNPKTRPRFIIWTGSVVFFLAGFVLFAMMVTSTNWFCAEVCHGVQVDSVAAWEMSTHAKVPCVTCHMPVNADPITHVIKKAGSLLKLYKTAAGQFQQPLNADQSVALNDFPDELCTQCHTDNRNFTPSPGIIIDHAVHTENEVRCAHCHNRVGHIQDDIVLAAEDPNTGEIGWRLDDWMEKPGCFRCHGQEEDAAATGECAACHTPDFELVPADHNVDNFVSEVHADMAMEEYARVEAARVRAEEMKPEVAPGVEAYTPAEPDHPWTDIPPANQINYCYTCHAQSFCSDCHGMEMP